MHSLLKQLCTDFFHVELTSRMKVVSLGSRLYLQSTELPELKHLRIVRAGWYLGDTKNNKLIPSLPFVMGLFKHELIKYVQLDQNSEQQERFLKGETLFVDDVIIKGEYNQQNGYAIVIVDEFVIVFVKIVNHMLKNEITAGWRQIT